MKKFNNKDYTIILAYLIFHLIIIICYMYSWLDRDFIKEYYFIVGIASTFLIFDILNKNLRKKKILILWSIIGLIQLSFYFLYKDISDLQATRGTYIDWLKGLPVALIVGFILNLINKKLYGDYVIITTFRLDSNEVLEGDNRPLRPADYLFSIIGFITIIFIVMIL